MSRAAGAAAWAPNPPCAGATSALPGRYYARSRHTGGVQACNADGSVRFFSDSIDVNTWRALGTSQGGETLADY